MQVARFEILGILGTGAYGVVALARDRADSGSDPVALKVLNRVADEDTEMMVRLRKEAQVLAWLRHPNIVRVHRLLEKDGRPVVVMDYIEGASAYEQIHRMRGGLPAGVALEIARQCALALEAAHDTVGPDGSPMRVVHRDIKSANLLVTCDGVVKVVDFGIASRTFEQPVGQLLGTRGYAAPERWSGGPDTPAVDVYALGVTLFELLTGKLMNQTMSPTRHDASIAMVLEHLNPPGFHDVEGLRDLIARMCRFDPLQRPGFHDLPDLIGAMVPEGVDMQRHAEFHVRPLHDARTARAAQHHEAWPDVAFLVDPGPVKDTSIPTSQQVRGLALRPETPMDVEPLLAIIGPRPWWSFRAFDAAAIIEALLALRGTRDPRVIARAHELTAHENPAIVDAAWDLLISAA